MTEGDGLHRGARARPQAAARSKAKRPGEDVGKAFTLAAGNQRRAKVARVGDETSRIGGASHPDETQRRKTTARPVKARAAAAPVPGATPAAGARWPGTAGGGVGRAGTAAAVGVPASSSGPAAASTGCSLA